MNGTPCKLLIRTLLACGFFLLVACGDGHDHVAVDDTTIDPATLCVDSQCGEKISLLTIPSAENIVFADDGRLFVSGGTNVFEVTRDRDAYRATPLYDGSCNFTGMAIVGAVLYAACFDGRLYAAQLDAQPRLRPIHDLGLGAPNGLAAGPEHSLFVVNGPVASAALPDPKIVRLTLAADDPFSVTGQSDWARAGLFAPNGVQIHDHAVYVSNSGLGALGEIRRYPINADGSAGDGTRFASLLSVPDDFSFVGDAVLAAYFGSGQVALISAQGHVLSTTAPLSFSFPSQIRAGQPPLFARDELLVTEKGLLGDNSSPLGNRLSLFRRTPAH